jgi:hypothetical protein
MEAVLGALVTAVVGGVLAFAREQIKNSREDSAFYRDRLLPSIENNTDTVKQLREAVTRLGKPKPVEVKETPDVPTD